MNPEPLVRPALQAGALVELVAGTPLDVALYWQFTRLAAPALRPLTESIRKAAAATLV
jgi:LysR family transcriptional regulator (chromosome initiation inhibitor)